MRHGAHRLGAGDWPAGAERPGAAKTPGREDPNAQVSGSVAAMARAARSAWRLSSRKLAAAGRSGSSSVMIGVPLSTPTQLPRLPGVG